MRTSFKSTAFFFLNRNELCQFFFVFVSVIIIIIWGGGGGEFLACLCNFCFCCLLVHFCRCGFSFMFASYLFTKL